MIGEFIELVNTQGFAIACVVAMGVYITKEQKISRENLKEITNNHKEEVDNLRNAVENNNKLLTRILDKLGEDVSI